MLQRNSIKLKLSAFDHRLLDKATNDIVSTATRVGTVVKGPIPLPSKIEKITVNRSTNVDKKSREQFQKVSHYRLIIIDSSPQAVEALRKLDIASGVEIKIEMNEV
jgi:small subunit ribosomal protein S10